MQNWQTLERREVLRTGDGKFLTVEYHTVRLPDGRILTEWPWVRTPDYVNILAETTDGRYLCFRQTKYAVEGLTLAVPGGYLEPDEEPLAAAQRELLEETGYAAAEWLPLGSYAVDGNRGCGTAHLFLARGAAYAQPVNADDLEEQELLTLTRAELAAALAAGDFKLLPWAALVALALARSGPA
jgi:ADP-ribose pyrophosphatase